jgi:hypothetical protein
MQRKPLTGRNTGASLPLIKSTGIPAMTRLELTDLETEQLRAAILTLPIGRYAPIINTVLEQLPETDRVAASGSASVRLMTAAEVREVYPDVDVSDPDNIMDRRPENWKGDVSTEADRIIRARLPHGDSL